MLIGLDERISAVEDIHVHIAVVGIHGRLDGIADVIESRPTGKGQGPRIRMRFAGGVAVDNPHQASGFGDDEIRVFIPGEKSRQFAEAFRHAAADHHAAIGGQRIGQ